MPAGVRSGGEGGARRLGEWLVGVECRRCSGGGTLPAHPSRPALPPARAGTHPAPLPRAGLRPFPPRSQSWQSRARSCPPARCAAVGTAGGGGGWDVIRGWGCGGVTPRVSWTALGEGESLLPEMQSPRMAKRLHQRAPAAAAPRRPAPLPRAPGVRRRWPRCPRPPPPSWTAAATACTEWWGTGRRVCVCVSRSRQGQRVPGMLLTSAPKAVLTSGHPAGVPPALSATHRASISTSATLPSTSSLMRASSSVCCGGQVAR